MNDDASNRAAIRISLAIGAVPTIALAAAAALAIAIPQGELRMSITLHWSTLPALLTSLSALRLIPLLPICRNRSSLDELLFGVIVLFIITLNLAAWFIGSLFK